MKIKTAELKGTQLDWAVAKCEELNVEIDRVIMLENGDYYVPTADWSQGGPIIERERLDLSVDFKGIWTAIKFINHEGMDDNGDPLIEVKGVGSSVSPLEAAMRCYVASKLGDEVEIPDDLILTA